jgi:hypothetical protein
MPADAPTGKSSTPACCESCAATAEKFAALERRVAALETRMHALKVQPPVWRSLPRDPRLQDPHDFYIQPVEPLPQQLDRRRIYGIEAP